MVTVDTILADIQRREGGEYTDRPDDKGGPTKWGITLTTFRQVHPDATVEDLKALDWPGAEAIYRALYVRPFLPYANGDTVLLSLMVDSGVQHGVSRVLGWITGEKCLTYAQLLSRRIRFYGQIVVSYPVQLTNLNGWLNRVCEFVR